MADAGEGTSGLSKLRRSGSFKDKFRKKDGESTSRAPSESGRDMDPDPPPSELENEEESVDQFLAYTLADPIGNILIGLAKDNAALSERVGLRESNVNIKDLTRAFYDHSLNQRGTEAESLESQTELIEKRLMDKELSSHHPPFQIQSS
jgi:hypothetical protein